MWGSSSFKLAAVLTRDDPGLRSGGAMIMIAQVTVV